MNEENNVLTIKTVQIQPIRNIITAIKDILTDATITFTKDGMKIINFDKLDYCSNSNGIYHDKLIIGNLNDKNYLLKILNDYNIDTIIHFAAQTHVDNSFGNSIQFTKDNVLGTHSILEAMRMYGKIQKFIRCLTK